MPESSFHRFRLEYTKPLKTAKTVKKRRTKTGCLMCRMRRKKCDESKPSCEACRRNYLVCKWPDSDAVNKDNEGSPTDSTTVEPMRQRASPDSDLQGVAFQNELAAWSKSHVVGFTPSKLPSRYKIVDAYLLEHYLWVTCHQLSAREDSQNPFIHRLLPLAYYDDKVLEGLMAVSGAHLASQAGRFEHDARSHYAITIRSVKHALLGWKTLDGPALIGLLTTTMLLCYFECIIGDTKGTIFFHLRASRTILVELKRRSCGVDAAMLDFLTECYAFSAISANVTLNTDFTIDRYIPMDDFLSPDALETLNKDNANHSSLFGSAHKLMGLIMPISQAARRLSRNVNTEYRLKELQKFENLILHSGTDVLSPNPSASEAAAAIYKQALFAYLYTMFHGASPPTEELYRQVEPCVNRFYEIMRYGLLGSAIITTLMWPALILGSCIRDPRQQTVFASRMETVPIKMGSCQRVREILTHLWAAQAEGCEVFGPYGLEIIMRRRDFNICMS